MATAPSKTTDETPSDDTILKRVTDLWNKAIGGLKEVAEANKGEILEKAFEFIENRMGDEFDVRLVRHQDGSEIGDERDLTGDGPNGFDLNTIIRGVGFSKRPTMMESDERRRQELQGVPDQEVANSTVNARDVAEFLVKRIVIEDDYMRDEIKKAIVVGLNTLVRDPEKWQRGQAQ